jgi:signal recognition particle subunit SEC65
VSENSEMFCNLIVIVPVAKREKFRDEYVGIMKDYYLQQDEHDAGKLHSDAEKKFKLLKEVQTEAYHQLCKAVTGDEKSPAEWTEELTHKAIAHLESLGKEEFEKRKHNRFLYPLVQDAFFPMNLDDKDKENVAVRLVCYKPQADEVIKVMRKLGFTSRTFSFNHEKWTQEKQQRQILKEQLVQKTSRLHQTATECF